MIKVQKGATDEIHQSLWLPGVSGHWEPNYTKITKGCSQPKLCVASTAYISIEQKPFPDFNLHVFKRTSPYPLMGKQTNKKQQPFTMGFFLLFVLFCFICFVLLQ